MVYFTIFTIENIESQTNNWKGLFEIARISQEQVYPSERIAFPEYFPTDPLLREFWTVRQQILQGTEYSDKLLKAVNNNIKNPDIDIGEKALYLVVMNIDVVIHQFNKQFFAQTEKYPDPNDPLHGELIGVAYEWVNGCLKTYGKYVPSSNCWQRILVSAINNLLGERNNGYLMEDDVTSDFDSAEQVDNLQYIEAIQRRLTAVLTPNENLVFSMLFEQRTLMEMSTYLNVTRERVGQIIQKIFRKIRGVHFRNQNQWSRTTGIILNEEEIKRLELLETMYMPSTGIQENIQNSRIEKN